jgi:hypothetical protein
MDGLGPCALCGCNPALGFASVTEDGVERWLCHPSAQTLAEWVHDEKPDCYHLWTAYGKRPKTTAEAFGDLQRAIEVVFRLMDVELRKSWSGACGRVSRLWHRLER